MADTPSGGEPLLKALPRGLLPVALFAYIIAVSFSLALNDPDLWWHLKVGELLLKTHALPLADPFSYTLTQPFSANQLHGMASQWMGQVGFYEASALGGLFGVMCLRSMLMVLPMAVLVWWLYRRGAGGVQLVALAAFPLMVFSFEEFAAFERPQAFSFLLGLLLVMSVERLRTGKSSRFWYAAPALLLALWSNLHGGYLIGGAIVMMYMAGDGAALMWASYKSKKPLEVKWAYYAALGVALLASGLNPNGFAAPMKYLLSLTPTGGGGLVSGGATWTTDSVLEYRPLMYFYTELGRKWLVCFAVFVGGVFAVLGLRYRGMRAIDVAELFIVLMLTVLAYRHARFYMLALTVLPYYMGRAVVEADSDDRWLRWVALGMTAIASVGFVYYMATTKPFLLRPVIKGQWISPLYPAKLSEFMKAQKVPGPIYNYYSWGGFLIWSLSPDYKVFVDGRALDEKVLIQADAIMRARGDWQGLLDSYGVNSIVIPVVVKETGEVVPLAMALYKSPAWALIFLNENSALYVRAAAADKALVYANNIDKGMALREMVRIEGIFIRYGMSQRLSEVGRAWALHELGQVDEANRIVAGFPGVRPPWELLK